jgi:probable F420-dependent oxidoreductase
MEVGLFAPLRSPVATPDVLVELGRACDERGVHSIWLGEHVVMFQDYESSYPGSRDGKFRFPAASGLLDMVSTLSFLAACTTKVRLGTGICILPQNNPVYVAKEYATVDFLSSGRLDFGIGVGWSWEEFAACGVPFAERGARCDEYLEVIRTLWCDEVSSFKGRFYDLPECLLYPKPIQQPMVPIIVGGHSDAALRRTARVGAGWYGVSLSPAETAEILAKLDRHLEAEGRSRSELKIIMGAVNDQIRPEMIHEYAEVGVTEVLIPFLRHAPKHLQANLDAVSPHLEAAASLR